MISCIIVDDEYLAIKILEEYASQTTDLQVKQTFKDARQALAFLQSNPVDILFLDIQMPYLDGFSLLQQLPEPPMVIFTTARHEYAIQAFDMAVLDYLLKPISFERFEKALDKARQQLSYQQAMPAPPEGPDYLMIKSDHRIIKIAFEDIVYIEGLNEYVKIHTTGKTYITLASLKELIVSLPATRFARIHKSYIVKTAAVESYKSNRVQLAGSTSLPVGRVYKEEFLTAFGGKK